MSTEHIEHMTAEMKNDTACQEAQFSLIAQLGLKPVLDGNAWCFLWGDNIQEGVCGFGSTVSKAAADFNMNCEKEQPAND